MPLNLPALSGQLADGFASPAADAAGCAAQWASAVEAYASGIVPPSLSVSTAAAQLEAALAGAFSSPNAIPGMESAFTAFGAAVGLGMAPLYAAVPPPAPVGFAAQFGGPAPATHAAAASAIAGLIDTWMKTGTATLVAPPNTLTPWT